MHQAKVRRFIKEHADVFNHIQDEGYQICDADIPHIQWFHKKRKEYAKNNIIQSSKTSAHWYQSKKVFVPICTVLILGVFMVSTSSGRAMMKFVYNTIVQWLDGEVGMWHGAEKVDYSDDPSHSEYQAIRNMNEKYSIRAATANSGVLDSVEFDESDLFISLSSTYSISDDSVVTLVQLFYDEAIELTAGAHYHEGQKIMEKSLDGIDIIGCVNGDSAFAAAFKDNTSINIYAENISYDEFVAFLQSIQFEP